MRSGMPAERSTKARPESGSPHLDDTPDSTRQSLRDTKRRRTAHETTSAPVDSDDDEGEYDVRPRKAKRRHLSHVKVSEPAFPRSAFQGWTAPRGYKQSLEREALSELTQALEKEHASMRERPEYKYIALDHFTIYRPDHSRCGHEMATLDKLQNRGGFDSLLFDGVLSVGQEQRFVQGVSFSTITIDGYGDAVFDLRDLICIQSSAAARGDVWYRLGRPAAVYKRFYDPFLWVATFTKQFVDYLFDHDEVTLACFRSDFQAWLRARHGDDPIFRKWLDQCGHLHDFRTTVSVHVGFLWKECWSVNASRTGPSDHPIWGEVDPQRLSAIPEQKSFERGTVVTPFAYECFKSMYFARNLEERSVTDPAIISTVQARKQAAGLTSFGAFKPSSRAALLTPLSLSDEPPESFDVEEGDVVILKPDEEGFWNRSGADRWFAYVQAVRPSADGESVLDVIWLYHPSDTTLGQAIYPFKNELFLSDNCSCGKDAYPISSVVGKASVAWEVTDPTTAPDLFVRRTYRTVHDDDTYDFSTLKESDFVCRCKNKVPIFEDCRYKYQIGDNVLVKARHPDSGYRLDPAQIVDFDLILQQVKVRWLKRKNEVECALAPPNELILSRDVSNVSPQNVIRKCQVRCFDPMTRPADIPVPYSRNGTGDFYFILGRSEEHVGMSQPEQLGSDLPRLEQSWNPLVAPMHKKMTGMGIFCGGGNFDRGLEEAGAVEFRFAVDWAERALHSYRANVEDPKNLKCFLGSVNDYLAQAITGSADELIARVDEVDVIAGGSPCPGFSKMQPDKQSESSLRNASMVASLVSFVDLYSPKYCILENVVTMTSGMGTDKTENVFSQILAAFVAMGYQVQQFLMDAWSYGSSQSRCRVFIVATAPGLEPFLQPPHTHDHPEFRQLALGMSANGRPFGNRRDEWTPFPHTSAQQATADLPDIGDSQPQICPSFPDHRTPSEENAASRTRTAIVPVRPRGMGLVQAKHAGLLSGELLEFFERLGKMQKACNSKTFSRVIPNRLFPTVLTGQRILCGFRGRVLHWDQHRPLTVMELRRAQGFPDHEVIIGTPNQQVVIIGNSVDRSGGLVLGLCLRASWLKGHTTDDQRTHKDHARTENNAQVIGSQAGDTTVPWTPDSSPDPLLLDSRHTDSSSMDGKKGGGVTDWLESPFRRFRKLLETSHESKEMDEGER